MWGQETSERSSFAISSFFFSDQKRKKIFLNLCHGNKLGNYYIDSTVDYDRVMRTYDSNTRMTTSVYNSMLGVISYHSSLMRGEC